MLKPTNILSYFIKDIKDSNECALYTQIINTNTIEIFYKDKTIYKITYNKKLNPIHSYGYKKNVIIDYFSRRLINYKIDSNERLNYKTLFYKKDNKILKDNYNCIYYEFIYNKYLIKKYFNYMMESKSLLCIKIKYYNGYKYLYKSYINSKYKRDQILIMNKYEANYINRFFSLFFVSRNY
jgi:hypothetical protein